MKSQEFYRMKLLPTWLPASTFFSLLFFYICKYRCVYLPDVYYDRMICLTEHKD